MALTRRQFGKGTAFATAALASGVGAFFPRLASASVPTGAYLSKLGEKQFWFNRRGQELESQPWWDDVPAGNKQYIADPAGQLTWRLGESGGFAIGYFSTLSFLGAYREKYASDYSDLLMNLTFVAPSERLRVLDERLHLHRLYFARREGIRPLSTSVNDRPDNDASRDEEPSERRTQPTEPMPPTLSALAMLSQSDSIFASLGEGQTSQGLAALPIQTVRPLETALSPGTALRAALQDTSLPRERQQRLSQFVSPGDALEAAPVSEETANVVAEIIQTSFSQLDETLEFDIASLDTTRLYTFDENGELRFERRKVGDGEDAPIVGWMEHHFLKGSFERGVREGRRAAVAYYALLEANQSLAAETQSDGTARERADKRLAKYMDVERLLSCYGAESFLQHSLDAACFRPAIRLESVCLLDNGSGENRVLRFRTPFVPLEFGGAANSDELQLLQQPNRAFVEALKQHFHQPVSEQKAPVSTQTLEEAGFSCCPAIFRHTNRILAVAADHAPELRSYSLKEVVLVPEHTSPWIFAGMGAALSTTHLVHLAKLQTSQQRLEFRDSIDSSITDLQRRSVDRATANTTGPAAAMMQYAEGYKTAHVLAHRVADDSARAAGANEVYKALQGALPEYFDELAADAYFSSTQIAQVVSRIATAVGAEIEQLRIQVEELTQKLEQAQDFIKNLATLIDDLEGQGSSVSNQAGLESFRANASRLITEQMKRDLDSAQIATLRSVQGLINTFVQVSTNITANVRNSMRGNVQICSAGINK